MKKMLTWFPEDKAAIINHFLSEVSLWFSIYYCPDNLVRVHLWLNNTSRMKKYNKYKNKSKNEMIENYELQK